MKHSRGVTMLEVLMSIIIISMVLALLFVLFMQIKREDDENQITSTFVINQTMFTKKIEEDVIKFGIASIKTCDYTDANITADSVVSQEINNFKCIKLTYGADYIQDNTAYIIVYKYYTKYTLEGDNYIGKNPKWMFSYSRGIQNGDKFKPTVVSTYDLPNEIILDEAVKVKYTNEENKVNSGEINIPIKSAQGYHYDVNIPFVFNNKIDGICESLATKIECNEH